MNNIARRDFLCGSVAFTGFALLSGARSLAGPGRKRKMTLDLACGRIGVRAGQREAIELAHRHGFESVVPDAGHLQKLSDAELEDLKADMKAKNLIFGAAGLPVNFRGDEDRFQEGLKKLPGFAESLQRAGVTRVGTWLSPGHASRTYMQNFKLHVTRLREVCRILRDHGQRFGLEYVGPWTSWTSRRFPFIHTMAETKDLLAEMDMDNAGLVLDSWHWYTAGETRDDLLTLQNRDVVAVDLNDAPAGIPVKEQIDSRRELPLATGVIDLKGFLSALLEIGYDGPVRAEPFNAALRELPPEQAVAATAKAMKKAFALLDEE